MLFYLSMYLSGKYRETRNSCLLSLKNWNGSRHLVFWSLGTLTVFPPLLFGPSFGFYSQRMHALWQEHDNDRRALWWWGISAARHASPWLQLHCLPLSSLPAKKTMNSFGAFFKFQMDIYDLILGCFYNFVIKPPGKNVIGSLDFSAFSGLVLGFGLFQLSF
jgi:hypothetical protein